MRSVGLQGCNWEFVLTHRHILFGQQIEAQAGDFNMKYQVVKKIKNYKYTDHCVLYNLKSSDELYMDGLLRNIFGFGTHFKIDSSLLIISSLFFYGNSLDL